MARANMDVRDRTTKSWLFSRDCLEVGVTFDEGADTVLTLFVNHFKSQLARNAKEKEDAKGKRLRQAAWVAKMLRRRYGSDLNGGDFVVLGDLNANYDAEELQPLLQLKGLRNIVQTRPLEIPGQDKITKADRWTHYYEGDKTTSQLDYVLLSPTLAKKSKQEKVIIEKRGLANYAKPYVGERFPNVGPKGSEASDHCAVFTTLQI